MLNNPLHQEIASLRDKLDEARETIRNMRDLLIPALTFPAEWRLSKAESRMLAALYRHPGGATQESLHSALSADVEPATDIKMVQVYICKLRAKLAQRGVKIKVMWGQGYVLEPESFPIVQAAIAESEKVKEDLKQATAKWL